jgi:sugar-specific transcriptional regulator TrmB
MFVDSTLMVTIDLDNHHYRALVILSEETIKTVLKDAGFTEKEAVIYIFLAKHEPLKGTEIAKLLRKDKAQVFRILKKLQAKGFVEATLEFPTRYTVVSFETILESVVKAKRDEVDFIEKTKEELISQLKKKSQIEPSLDKFLVIKGKKRIDSKIHRMFQDTKHQISVAITVPGLMLIDRYGVFDVALNQPLKSQIQHRFLVELSEQNVETVKAFLKRMPKTGFNFKARNPELSGASFPRMIVRDSKEVLFFTSRHRTSKARNEEVCMWTNSKSLVETFKGVFDEIWRNSADIPARISEIETGKPSPSICIIGDFEEARKKYEDTLQSAKEEIVLMASSKNLVAYWKSRARLKEWSKKCVHVRIMAPIVGENLGIAEQISKIFPVKHIPVGYPEATIIDGKHYFQFHTSPTVIEKDSSTINFENTFYTNNLQYVSKMKKMFDDVWQNARAPSPITLEAILKKSRKQIVVPSSDGKPSYFKKVNGLSFRDWKLNKTATEKDVLNKIINTSNFPRDIQSTGQMKLHGSSASAVIHPPPHFNLPDMVITVFHIEKHSSFGEEDAMLIYLWLEVQTGHSYVPLAYVGDNPKAQDVWKAFMAGTPAGQNVQLVKKDELQIQVHGSTLFAGWTKQIPLLTPKYALPPSFLLIEGYGDLKTDSYTLLSPSNYKTEVERNGFDAFVTFFHPASKYSGPGTDGFFARDYTAITYPPEFGQKKEHIS